MICRPACNSPDLDLLRSQLSVLGHRDMGSPASQGVIMGIKLVPSHVDGLTYMQTILNTDHIDLTSLCAEGPSAFRRPSQLVISNCGFNNETGSDPRINIPFCRFLTHSCAVFASLTSKSTTTASVETWKIAQRWLKNCESQHILCQERRGTTLWHPTRLLDIGIESKILSWCFLVENCDLDKSQPYVTLSHRWGHAPFLKLRPENFEELKHGIPISLLPKTFQDAARRMSIRYMWIDSLCIIQDDSISDWAQEAAAMDGYSLYKSVL